MFLRVAAPRCGLTAGGVTQASLAAGLDGPGWACGSAPAAALRGHRDAAGGAPLAEIGQVLGTAARDHRDLREGRSDGAARAGAAVAGSAP